MSGEKEPSRDDLERGRHLQLIEILNQIHRSVTKLLEEIRDEFKMRR